MTGNRQRPMRLVHLLLLLLIALGTATAIEGQSDTFQMSSQRLLTDTTEGKLPPDNDETEERGVMPRAVSNLQRFFKKSPGVSSKLASARKNTDLATAVEKMPLVKKLEKVVEKNPRFVDKLSKDPAIKKLAKDPQVAKVSTMLERNNVKVTKDTINQLRAAAGNDPAKLSKLDVVDGVLEMGMMAVFGAIALLVLVAMGYAIVSYAPLLFQSPK